MRSLISLCFAFVVFVAEIGCTEQQHGQELLGRYSLSDDAKSRWKLPSRLREISGLARAPDGRLFAVDDEKAIIYELDYSGGRVVKEFSFGSPPVKGDFEGIAHIDNRLYLVTSDGFLFAGKEGLDDERVAYEKTNTGLGDYCEIEGLAENVNAAQLLILCKNMRDKDAKLAVYVWQLNADDGEIVDRFNLPISDILAQLQRKELNPSGIVVDNTTRAILIVAAKQRAVIELDQAGKFVRAVARLRKNRHPQPEGIAISSRGELIIADEGRKSRGRLTVYPPRNPNSKNEK